MRIHNQENIELSGRAEPADPAWFKWDVVNYFKGKYKKKEATSLEDQLKLIKNFPHLFNEEERQQIGDEVLVDYMKEILSQFAKEKNIRAR